MDGRGDWGMRIEGRGRPRPYTDALVCIPGRTPDVGDVSGTIGVGARIGRSMLRPYTDAS